jgi:hypothetical protein
MRRWPPLLWLPVYVASELILLGSHHRWDLLIPGIALSLVAFAMALRLALARDQGRPRPRWYFWAVGGVGAYYVVSAVAAGILSGGKYAVAAILAGVVPMTAVALALATARLADETDGPSIGLDDESPFGDTPEHAEEVREWDAAQRYRPADAHPGAGRRSPAPTRRRAR